MRSIELQTTQNVTINYDLALLRDRVLAFFVDLIIIISIVILLSISLAPIAIRYGLDEVLAYLVISPVFTFYTLIFESLADGQTPGKMALRIKVVHVEGRQMGFTDYLLRWAFRLVDVWLSFGAVAVVLTSSTPRAQRLGGLASNSTVVKSNPSLAIELRDVLRINTTENHVPKYPEVRHFKESDMLLMKKTIDRYRKYGNEAHLQALNELTRRVCDELGLEPPRENKIQFLKDLIKDYIVLTR